MIKLSPSLKKMSKLRTEYASDEVEVKELTLIALRNTEQAWAFAKLYGGMDTLSNTDELRKLRRVFAKLYGGIHTKQPTITWVSTPSTSPDIQQGLYSSVQEKRVDFFVDDALEWQSHTELYLTKVSEAVRKALGIESPKSIMTVKNTCT